MRSGQLVALIIVALAVFPASSSEYATQDGLKLRLSDVGEAEGIFAGATRFKPVNAPRPMFRLREIGSKEWHDMPTAVDAAHADRVAALGVQMAVANAVAKDQGLGLAATYFPGVDHIRVWGSVLDLRLGERSVELMCALPASAAHVLWGVDIAEKADPFAQQPGLPTPDRAAGPYTLWLDAFDFDVEMGAVSVIGQDGNERVVAVLAPDGSAEQVNQKWRTFVVEGIRESDFVGDTLRVRISNFVGGCTMVDIGGAYLMDARKGTVSAEDANVLTAKSEDEVIRRAVGSWVSAPKYRPKKGVRQWFFQRKSLAIRDGCWVEIAIRRGERRSGSTDI